MRRGRAGRDSEAVATERRSDGNRSIENRGTPRESCEDGRPRCPWEGVKKGVPNRAILLCLCGLVEDGVFAALQRSAGRGLKLFENRAYNHVACLVVRLTKFT